MRYDLLKDCRPSRRDGLGIIAAAAVALSLASSALLGGCVESTIAAAGATAGFGLAQGQAESFIRGELKSARMAPLAVTRAAVLAAMDELQLEVTERKESTYADFFRSKAAGGREIKVYLLADSPLITRITIRVGMMGDPSVSRLVMSRIDAALQPAMPHPPIPLDGE